MKAQIFIGGDHAKAIDLCRQFCMANPLCISVVKADFVYVAGMESGICATIINYARFPDSEKNIKSKAIKLGKFLMEGLCQRSFSVLVGKESIWFHREA